MLIKRKSIKTTKRKSTRRKSIKRKSIKRKSTRRKSIKTTKRKSTRRKSIKRNQKIMDGELIESEIRMVESFNEVFLTTLYNKLTNVEYTDPFKMFYKMEKIEDKYIIYVTNKTERYNNFKYKIIDSDYEIDEKYKKEQFYSRKEKEALKYLLSYDYYTELNFNNIKLIEEHLKNYNPNLFDSYYFYDYLISSTMFPSCPQHLVVYGINKKLEKHFSALDFYFDPTFLFDMYYIFNYLIKIDSEYIVFNSIELGSLYETYHFHIIKSKIPNDISSTISESNVYENKNSDDDCFTNSYFIKLSENEEYNKKIIYLLPYILYQMRYYEKYKYFCSIHLFNKDNNNYILISFRRVGIELFKLNEHKKFNQSYWDSLFSLNKDVIYFPFGVVSYNSVNGNNNISSEIKEEIEKKKTYFHLHPLFMKTFKEIISMDKNNIKYETFEINLLNEKFVKEYDSIDSDECINLDIFDNKKELKCSKMPILYNLRKCIIGDDYYDNGNVLINGTYFYFIKCERSENLKLEDIKEDIHLKLYKTIETKEFKFYLFSFVKTYLTDYIDLEKKNLTKDPSLIHTFLIMIIYKMMNLYKQGYKLKYLDIYYFYVSDNQIKLREYKFSDEVIISVAKELNESCKYSIIHEGNDIFLPFSVSKNSDDIILKDIKNIVNQLHYFCKEREIINLLLEDVNKLFDDCSEILYNK